MKILVTTALSFALCAPIACLAQAYAVTIDTSGLGVASGNLDMQFLPAVAGNALPATVAITGFQPANSLTGSPELTGNAYGALVGTATLGNTGPYNDLYQALTFGPTVTFTAEFAVDKANPPAMLNSDTQFSLVFYDNDASHVLGSAAADSSFLRFNIGTDGAISYNTANGGTPIATVALVPEPGGLWLWAIGAAGIAGLAAGRRRTRRPVISR